MATFTGRFFVAAAILALATPASSIVAADPVEDFYRGKSINMIIATSPGGDYDRRARLLSRHMGRHIPGNPTIVPRNMPGGVGLQAANYLATVAPRDGTVLHAIMQNMSAHQALGGGGVEFDTRKFFWIGNTTNSPNVINSWHTTGIKTIYEVMKRELVVGAPGTATSSVYFPRALNALVGTKFKIVSGYPGGNVVNLAMERGEVGGRGSNSWASWKSTKPEWLKEKKIIILVQSARKRHAELADIPTMIELAKNEADRQVLAFMSADTEINRAYVTTPGTPPERVAALRKAFDATMKDPAFLAEAAKMKMDISPSSGVEAQKVAEFIANTPASVLARTKKILEIK
ncbi:MAG: Bug family tripartite tricarboxylate transporter substrate binding protein [Xanthobacteraceae bacterium]